MYRKLEDASQGEMGLRVREKLGIRMYKKLVGSFDSRDRLWDMWKDVMMAMYSTGNEENSSANKGKEDEGEDAIRPTQKLVR